MVYQNFGLSQASIDLTNTTGENIKVEGDLASFLTGR
jgi:hypothetical protein